MTYAYTLAHGHPDDPDIFAEYRILCEPLPTREERVFGRVTYASHWLAYAAHTQDARSRYLLFRHGGASGVIQLCRTHDDGMFDEALPAMPPKLSYSILQTLFSTVSTRSEDTARDVSAQWRAAAIENRIRKGRPRKGMQKVWIQTREDQEKQT